MPLAVALAVAQLSLVPDGLGLTGCDSVGTGLGLSDGPPDGPPESDG
jgi:hypothetical protein